MDRLTVPENESQQSPVTSTAGVHPVSNSHSNIGPGDSTQTASPNLLAVPTSATRPVSTLQRSSSLDVHAPSPPPSEDQPSEFQAAFRSVPNSTPGISDTTSPFNGEWVFLQNQNLQSAYTYSDDTGSNKFSIITPGSPYVGVAGSHLSSPRLSSLRSEGFTVVDSAYPHLQRHIPRIDTPSASTRLSSPIMPGYNVPRDSETGSLPYPTLPTGNPNGGRLNLPQSQPPKYPPCRLTEDGLLIVPSVPGPPDDESEGSRKGGNKSHPYHTAPVRKTRFTSSIQRNSIPEESYEAPALVNLGPNVIPYRKGKYTRRRYPS
ncbi:hypothetical protein PISL3812_00283 [Talaromyces islandicus]|uniref:Uncharacterized protein n=1 Tax=Talaromyces islandicus TaxID=28573 RepID=A0A0U1LKL1_TALIS|nr:hypothetical protein PISL3812_00283 [Talaromyces islandicus]